MPSPSVKQVQQNSGTGTSGTAQFTSTCAAGNAIWAVVSFTPRTATVTWSDNNNGGAGSYTNPNRLTSTFGGSDIGHESGLAKNINTSSNNVTVTASFSTSVSWWLHLYEVQNTDATNPLNISNGAESQSDTTPDVTTTTTVDDCLIIAAFIEGTGAATYSAGSGYTFQTSITGFSASETRDTNFSGGGPGGAVTAGMSHGAGATCDLAIIGAFGPSQSVAATGLSGSPRSTLFKLKGYKGYSR